LYYRQLSLEFKEYCSCLLQLPGGIQPFNIKSFAGPN
jgi:hypothetical protein